MTQGNMGGDAGANIDPVLLSDLQAFEHQGIFDQSYMRAQRLEETDRPGLIDAVADMTTRAGLAKPPRLYIIEHDDPMMLTNPKTGSVGLTMGLLHDRTVSNDMLVAGIAHEIGHHQVPLTGVVGKGFQIATMATVIGGAAVTLGALVSGHPEAANMALEATVATSLVAAAGSSHFSKQQEYAADHYAAYASGRPSSLIDLLQHGEQQAQQHPSWQDHPVSQAWDKAFGGHPATDLRAWRLQRIEQNLDAEGNPVNRRDVPGPLRRHL